MSEESDAFQLTDALGQLLAQYRDANRAADEGDREPITQALLQVIRFIQHSPQLRNQGFEEPFLKLGHALGELDYGRVHPLLEPLKVRGRGRTPKTRRQELIECAASATLSALMSIGYSRKQAAEAVVRPLRSHGFLAGRHGTEAVDPVARVLGWREGLEAGPKPSAKNGTLDEAATVYRDLTGRLAFQCAVLNDQIKSGNLARETAGQNLIAMLEDTLSRRSIVF